MIRQRYLDPTNEVAFKKVFADTNKLRDLLNSILRLPEGKKIEEIYFVPAEEIPDLGQGRHCLFHLKCRDQTNVWFVVELPSRKRPHSLKRVQYYSSQAYNTQLRHSQSYSFLLPVVIVSILKKSILPSYVDVISYHKILEDKTQEQHLCDLSYVFVELDKFTKEPHNLQNSEDEWLFFLKNAEKVQTSSEDFKDPLVREAFQVIERSRWSETDYDIYLHAHLIIETEEATKEESFEAGLAQGEAIGLEKGERRKSKEVALACLEEGLDIDLISRITGLSLETLEALKFFRRM